MRTTPTTALALALAAVTVAPSLAWAQSSRSPADPAVLTHVQTSSELAAMCDPAWGGVPRLEAIAYCQGFLTSFGQYHTLLYPPAGADRPLFCVPVPGPTVAQSGVAFAAWARGQANDPNEPALDGLLRWAQASFPCPAAPAANTAAQRRAR